MIVDIINKKRLGQILSKEELEYFFNGYLEGKVTDYQMSAMLMAICIRNMTEREIFDLCDVFIKSGEILDFSDIEGVKVDKHSTGGVGDKTTMVIAPIVASLGVPVVKMSGRGLGFTGGTIDKLESIPGFRTDLNPDEIKRQVNDIGLVVASQTANLAPMDKKIYALRDVTGTVESIPLIATSVMSKKIASGADKILIDIKVGKGALLKTEKDAKKLSDLMIKIGKVYNKEVRCLITNMDNPLGTSIGNALEVIEVINILTGKEKNYLTDLCIELSSNMLSMAKGISIEEAKEAVQGSIYSGLAYQKFLDFVKCQGGVINNMKITANALEVISDKTGVIDSIDALEFGKLSVALGAGRENKDDIIDPSVGIVFDKLVGDKVEIGDRLCTIYTNKNIDLANVKDYITIK